jgi:3-deoxy-manno-octulosonate cytidylyltransferase (CMP-KDO synthetase)
VVKVVVDANDNALYFSRASIPHHREGPAKGGHYGHKHLGLYAYRRDFLLRLAALPQTALERAESLEQLRALEHGHRIRAVETQYDSVGVDTPEDLDEVRQKLEFRLKAEATRV